MKTRTPIVCAHLLGALGLGAIGGCGSDSTGPSLRDKLNGQEAQLVATALFEEMYTILDDTEATFRLGSLENRGLALSANRRPDTVPISGVCRAGGRIVGNVTLTDNIDDDGTGTVVLDLVTNPQACVVSAGTRSLPVTGNPSLNYKLTMEFTGGELTSDLVFRAGGGFKWPSGSCTVDYTVNITVDAGGSIKGRVCDQNVSASF